jgi:hypothetical protein
MSGIKGIFDKIYIGSNIVEDTNVVKIDGDVSTTGNLTIGTGKYISFNGVGINSIGGIRDNNGTLQFKNYDNSSNQVTSW